MAEKKYLAELDVPKDGHQLLTNIKKAIDNGWFLNLDFYDKAVIGRWLGATNIFIDCGKPGENSKVHVSVPSPLYPRYQHPDQDGSYSPESSKMSYFDFVSTNSSNGLSVREGVLEGGANLGFNINAFSIDDFEKIFGSGKSIYYETWERQPPPTPTHPRGNDAAQYFFKHMGVISEITIFCYPNGAVRNFFITQNHYKSEEN